MKNRTLKVSRIVIDRQTGKIYERS